MPGGLVWYFGYGSLMWNPGFHHEAFEPAVLEGWSRALCIYSTHYRGTAARPGLVLGLRPGGRCMGRAIGVAPEREECPPQFEVRLGGRRVLVQRVFEVALRERGVAQRGLRATEGQVTLHARHAPLGERWVSGGRLRLGRTHAERWAAEPQEQHGEHESGAAHGARAH